MHGARILFNDLILFRQRSGIGFYAEMLLKHLDPELPVVRLSDLPIAAPLKAVMSALNYAKTKGGGLRASNSLRPDVFKLMDAYLSRTVRLSGHWDIYHEPDAIPLSLHAPTMATVHDLTVTLFPEWHPEDRVRKFEENLVRVLSETKMFIAVSKKTKADMVRHWGVEADRIRVVPEAPRPQFKPLPRDVARPLVAHLHLPERYFLFCGTLEPRKNIVGLLEAYSKLPKAFQNNVGLVLCGGWGWNSGPIREALMNAGPNVKHLGYVSDDDLAPLTAAADALVYPSFYEGFGLPPLEAMACGVPVISSHEGSLKEILGDSVAVVDPKSTASISEAMKNIFMDELYRRDLIERGTRRVKKYTWDKTAAATSQVYREFLNAIS